MLAAVTAQYRAEVIPMNQTARRTGEPWAIHRSFDLCALAPA
jgi:hypothetical protein